MPTLIGMDGGVSGERFEITAEMLLGRRDADITIEDAEVSRRHAVVRVIAGELEIEDLASLNGTWVNGVRLTGPRRLSGGDVIRVGQTSLSVELERALSDFTFVGQVDQGPTAVRAALPRSTNAQPTPLPLDPTPMPTSTPEPMSRSRQVPVVADDSVQPPLDPFRVPSLSGIRSRRAIATRRFTPMVLSLLAILTTAAALLLYFARR